MKKLSRNELKNVVGGNVPDVPYSCHCIGSVGDWTYLNGHVPDYNEILTDIGSYCSSGVGTCNDDGNAPL